MSHVSPVDSKIKHPFEILSITTWKMGQFRISEDIYYITQISNLDYDIITIKQKYLGNV